MPIPPDVAYGFGPIIRLWVQTNSDGPQHVNVGTNNTFRKPGSRYYAPSVFLIAQNSFLGTDNYFAAKNNGGPTQSV